MLSKLYSLKIPGLCKNRGFFSYYPARIPIVFVISDHETTG
jgi:hypothetical protein